MLVYRINVDSLSAYLFVFQAWDLDLSSNKLTFYFTESVNATLVRPAGFALQNSYTSSAISYKLTSTTSMTALTGGSNTVNTNFAAVLPDFDINELKFLARASTSSVATFDNFFSNSFLTVPYGATYSLFLGTSSITIDIIAYLFDFYLFV